MRPQLKTLQDGVRVVPRSLVWVSIAVALSLLGDQMLYAVLPVVHEAAGIPVTAIGLLLSANRIVRLVTNSLAGYVIERFGRRWPFILALLLGGATTIAYGVMQGLWAFLVARLLWGTAWSFIRIEGLSTALDVAVPETRGRYMGIFQAISRLGGAIAMLTGGFLTDAIGYRLTFIIFGWVTCAAALLAYVEMRRRPPNGSATPIATKPATPSNSSLNEPAPPVTTRPETPDTSPWQVMVASLGTFSTLLVIGGAFSATLGYMLQTRFGEAPHLGTMTIGIASLTGFLLGSRGFFELGLAPLTGYMGDRWGRHRLIMVAMPLGALMIASMALRPSLLAVAFITPLIFVAGVTLNVAFNAVAGDLAPPDKRSMFLSRFVTFQDLGAAIGPLLGYWIAPLFGLSWLYVSGAIILFLVSLLYITAFSGHAIPKSV